MGEWPRGFSPLANLDLMHFDCLWILFVFIFPTIECNKGAEITRHLDMGKQFLSKGQYADALTHYHAAIDLDSQNYQTLYRRATVYLAMGKSSVAITDLDQVIALKPDFTAARMQRGNILLKKGELQKAEEDLNAVVKVEGNRLEVEEKIKSVAKVMVTISEADKYFIAGDYDYAEKLYTKAIEICQWYDKLYQKRGECYELSGNIQKAIADFRTVSKLSPDNTDTYYKVSMLYYNSGDVEESLNQIRECLKLDPDHKKCFAHYKKVKQLAKMRESLNDMVKEERWLDCLEKSVKVLKYERTVSSIQLDVYRHTCKCNLHAGHIGEAIAACSEVLNHGYPNDVNVLCDRAEAYLLNEQYDDAVNDFQNAVNSDGESRRAKEGLQKAQKLKKQAGKKDYYKILGVRRNANKRDILKAYRKLAQQWHPDNFIDEREKKRAENKFIDIAAAKEVLTDTEKRAQFDNGEDPLDPEQQHGHNPFQGGFPFGSNGGPFSFQFHFG